jgi:hypothetical protein
MRPGALAQGRVDLAAMIRVYEQGWPKTLLKFIILSMAYWVLFAFASVGVMLFSFLGA